MFQTLKNQFTNHDYFLMLAHLPYHTSPKLPCPNLRRSCTSERSISHWSLRSGDRSHIWGLGFGQGLASTWHKPRAFSMNRKTPQEQNINCCNQTNLFFELWWLFSSLDKTASWRTLLLLFFFCCCCCCWPWSLLFKPKCKWNACLYLISLISIACDMG